ncbi:MAG: CocE/NonD family hydrolase C-terminal non-catalytic domain-containing protein, partial [Nesterenkonia sp.]
TTDPLTERVELLGSPTVELALSADRPVAMVAVRLSDVGPDDAATRISYGLYNLNHTQGSDNPQPLEPGERQTVRVELNGMAQSLPAGHRLRVSVSTSYWPVVWPSPEKVTLTIDPMQSSLTLPVRPTSAGDDEKVPTFGEPEGAPPIETTQIQPGEQDWEYSRNLVDLSGKLQVVKDLGVVRIDDIDLDVTRRAYEDYSFVGEDVNSVCGETFWTMGFERGDWKVRTTTKTVLTSTPTDFHLSAELDAYEGDQRVLSKNWNTTIPRDFI